MNKYHAVSEVKKALSGPVPSLSTPFKKDGEVDYDSLRNMVDFYIDAGAKSLMLTAGDSHYVCLTEAEIAEVTRITVEHTAGRAMVISADRYYPTAQAIEFAGFCRETGADLHMVMPPDWAGSCTPETMAEHYAAVAEVMPVMIVTNVFIARGQKYGLETLKKTVELTDKVVAIKDDMCGEFARRMGLLVGQRWAVISGGKKENHMNTLPYGCDGYLSTYMRFQPDIAKKYWGYIEQNDQKNAARVIAEYDIPLFNLLGSLTGGFDTGIHAALEIFGLAERWRRKPYATISDKDFDCLKDFFRNKNFVQ